MLSNSLARNPISHTAFTNHVRSAAQTGVVLPFQRGLARSKPADGFVAPAVEISPADGVKRRGVVWDGMMAEIVQATTRQRTEYRLSAPVHMLAYYEEGARSEGETVVEGAAKSNLRDIRKKLTFVPAGHRYHECHEPRLLAKVAYFYFAPEQLRTDTGDLDLAPRLYFEDPALSSTASKLISLMESANDDNRPYLAALGVVLVHELKRLYAGSRPVQAPARGGLAAWQQRTVATYIEGHLAEQVPISTLAGLVRLSPFHFCRAFKQTFGAPPHQYHSRRRIEWAKALLAQAGTSVTDIGFTLGFKETSSFTATFRKMTGFTPTGYRRSLA